MNPEDYSMQAAAYYFSMISTIFWVGLCIIYLIAYSIAELIKKIYNRFHR